MTTFTAHGTDKPVLTVGVTGHRAARLEGHDVSWLAGTVSGVLARIRATAEPDHAFRLVSSLADGADSIVADAALSLDWALDIVLPFSRADNLLDYPDPAARAALNDRLAQADAVFSLDGERGAPDVEARAYERAGRIMLAQSDILLAVWDGEAPRGRGGTAQIVAEALAQGVPIIHIAIGANATPELLWNGLAAGHRTHRSPDTVTRGSLDDLDQLVVSLADRSSGVIEPAPRRRSRLSLAVVYPILLALTGVRRLRGSDFVLPAAAQSEQQLTDVCRATQGSGAFAARLRRHLVPAFATADASSIEAARRFRSAYIANFALAALAVLISLAGLVLPAGAKPFLAALELATVGTILVITHVGRRAGWHESWLDRRQTAERLRCVAVSAQLGELALRGKAHSLSRCVAQALRLPDVQVDRRYLEEVRDDLMRLIDDQIGYLDNEVRRMHRLEHRLHRAGEWLFGLTAAVCLAFLVIEIVATVTPAFRELVHPTLVWGTIGSAALPTIGAAIYGIRMQGDFAGIAERNAALAGKLRRVREGSLEEPLSFDTLLDSVRLVSELLTQDLTTFLQAYHARPLALPG